MASVKTLLSRLAVLRERISISPVLLTNTGRPPPYLHAFGFPRK